MQENATSDLDICLVRLHTLMSCLIDLMKFLTFTLPHIGGHDILLIPKNLSD